MNSGGLVCFVKNKEFKLTFCQHGNSSLETLGFKLLSSLKEILEVNELNIYFEKINFVKIASKDELIAFFNIINMDFQYFPEDFKFLKVDLCITDVF